MDEEPSYAPPEELEPTTEQLAHRRMLTERVRRDYEEMYEETRQDE